jgi:two-component system sensor histidine kinase YesM
MDIPCFHDSGSNSFALAPRLLRPSTGLDYDETNHRTGGEALRLRNINKKQRLLMCITLLLLFALVAVTGLTYLTYREDLIAQSTETTQLLLDQLTLNLDGYVEELYRLCLSPYYNRQVMQQLALVPSSPQEKLNKRRIVENYLSEMLTLPREDILRAHIMTDDVYSMEKTRYPADIPKNFTQDPGYLAALNTTGPVFLPVRVEAHGRAGLSVFSIVQQLRSLHNNQVLGVIRVDANYQGIKAVCDRLLTRRDNALMIIDSSGNQIYFNSYLEDSQALDAQALQRAGAEEGSRRIEAGGQMYLVNVKSLSSTDWHIIDVHSMREITRTAVNALGRSALMALLCVLLAVVISVLIADTLQSNTLLTRKVYEAKFLEKDAQYAALYSQMQPHFLFNALNTIKLLMRREEPEAAIQCLDMLSVLLRGMVNARHDIPLHSELRIVESYLALQKTRFDALTYSIAAEDALGDYLLPALTIQPIVENALIHGCEPKRWDAEVRISAAVENGEVVIAIADNGVGMAPGLLQKINQSIHADTQELYETGNPSSGVGLINISRRIRLKYGSAYGLEVDSTPGEGTSVRVHLPLKKEDGVNVSLFDRRG